MSYDYSITLLMTHDDAERVSKFEDHDEYGLFKDKPMHTPLFEEDRITFPEPHELGEMCKMTVAPHFWVRMQTECRNWMPLDDIMIRMRLAQSDGWQYVLSWQGETDWELMVRGENFHIDQVCNGIHQRILLPYIKENRETQAKPKKRLIPDLPKEF